MQQGVYLNKKAMLSIAFIAALGLTLTWLVVKPLISPTYFICR